MPRLAGVDIPDNKRIVISLTYIYGIGHRTAEKILAKTGIDPSTRARDLQDGQLVDIRKYVEGNIEVEGDARRKVSQNIKWLMDIGCYRGLRHRKGLPVRGQRTSTNARTRKGPPKAIAGKKKTPTSK